MNMRVWEDSETDLLIGWLEENPGVLQGPSNNWTAQAKEAVFSGSDGFGRDLDAKKIKSKFHNIHHAWRRAKAAQLKFGYPLKKDECPEQANGKIIQSIRESINVPETDPKFLL